METAAAYASRFVQLRSRYEREHGDWNWEGFVDWLIKRRPSLRPASYRQYRAAALWAVRTQAGTQAQRLIGRLQHEGVATRRGLLAPRTSSHKAKSISAQDLHKIVGWLQSRDGRWNDLTAQWLFWNWQTGLRPIEWRDVTLHADDNGIYLRVRNAKHSQGRAHGEYRSVHLQIDAQAATALHRFLLAVQGDYAAAYQGCRLALHRATVSLWPRRVRRPTLYSGRHQFSADAKASGLDPVAIAALMGHAVTDTHQTHYGKRRCGHSGLIVAADPGDVQRVQERMQARELEQGPADFPPLSGG